MAPQAQWIHSFVTDDKIYCVYIAPDEANMDPQTGGMDLWDVAMPPDVDMRVYNGNEMAAQEFIKNAEHQRRTHPRPFHVGKNHHAKLLIRH